MIITIKDLENNELEVKVERNHHTTTHTITYDGQCWSVTNSTLPTGAYDTRWDAVSALLQTFDKTTSHSLHRDRATV